MARLVIESGPDKGMIFPIYQTATSLGRSSSNTIQIIDRRLSRQHSELYYLDGRYVLKDLGSKNGTYLNDTLLAQDHILKNGDRIKMGDTILIFESEPYESAHNGDTTTKVVRFVEDMPWGQTQGTRQAGVHLAVEVDLETSEGEFLKDSHKRLEILYQVADAIRSILNFDELLEKIMSIIYSVIQPDRGFILLKSERTGELVPKVIKKRDEAELEISISSSIVKKCIDEKISILVTDATSDKRFAASESIILNKIRSAICSPLIYKDEVLGVIYIDTTSRVVSYGEEELELLTGIANQSAMAIANANLHKRMIEQQRMEKEIEIARSIQMNLLPKVYPVLSDLEISAMSTPAKHVGGDYYDFILLSENRCGFAIADVSGKGVPAAILTSTIRSTLQVLASKPEADILDVIKSLNHITCRDATNNMFVTLVYGILDANSKTFEYINAGHTYPFIIDQNNELKELKVGGCFLGIMEQIEYQKETVSLTPSSILVIYTDGVTDTMKKDETTFGVERLIKLVKENKNLSALEIRNKIFDETTKFRENNEQFDDFTLIVIKSVEKK